MAKRKSPKANPELEPLTEKQEAFCVAFIICGQAAKAYREAYGYSPDHKAGWIYSTSSELMDNPKIIRRIAELRERARTRGDFTVDKALEEYEEARKIAKEEKQASAAVSATSAKVKLLGMDAPSKVDLLNSDGSLSKGATIAAVDARIAELLGKYAGGNT